MATIQQYKFTGNGSAGLIETVYAIIKSRSGKVTSKDLDGLMDAAEYEELLAQEQH